MEEYYYDSSLTGEELDTALRQIPQVAACAEAAQAARTAAESWAHGGTGIRSDEETDNAKTYAERAKASAEAAAGSAASARGSADTADEKLKLADKAAGDAAASATAARNSEDAARASQEAAASSETSAETSAGRAAGNAERAEAAADSADGAAERAEEAARNAQSIAQGQKGYYATPELLTEAVPSGEDGDWAIIGSTDTIWVWDSDTGKWLDTHKTTDLSNYYTKPQADAELNELQKALAQQIAAKQDKPAYGVFVPVYPNAGAHNSIYRGKDITSRFADKSLFTAINNGTFDDLYIGDYFDITIGTSFTASEKVRCLLAGFDVYLGCGDATVLTRHHAVIVPMNCFAAAGKMCDTNDTTGSYAGSYMHSTILPEYARAIKAVFGTNLIQSREYLGNEINKTVASMAGMGYTGATTNHGWYGCDLRLMSEIEVYGSSVWSSGARDVGTAKSRLPLFTLAPNHIVCGLGGAAYALPGQRYYWWLSDVASALEFAIIGGQGMAFCAGAGFANGVRPRWLIG